MKKIIFTSVLLLMVSLPVCIWAQTNKLAKFTSTTMPAGLTQSVLYESGNLVGIGTTPTHTLEMPGYSNFKLGEFVLSSYNASQTAWQRFSLGAGIELDGATGNYKVTDTQFIQGTFSLEGNGFVWSTHAGALSNPQTLSQWNANRRMVLTGGGNLGVGTMNPTEKLTVIGKIQVFDTDEPPPGTTNNRNYVTITGNQIYTLNTAGRGPDLYLNKTGGNSVIVGDPSITSYNTGLTVAGAISGRTAIIGARQRGITSGPHTDYKLAVEGKIVAKSIYVTVSGWGDFIFDKSYKRMNWKEKKDFFEANKHLPGVSNAAEIETNGVNVEETLKHVTINVEENSLDIVELYQRLEKLEKENKELKKELSGRKNTAAK